MQPRNVKTHNYDGYIIHVASSNTLVYGIQLTHFNIFNNIDKISHLINKIAETKLHYLKYWPWHNLPSV